MAQRVTTYLYRGLQFLAIGFGASVVGHGLTKYMVRHNFGAGGLA